MWFQDCRVSAVFFAIANILDIMGNIVSSGGGGGIGEGGEGQDDFDHSDEVREYNNTDERVEMLLKVEGIQVNQTCNWGATPLAIAAYKGCHEVVEMLLGRKDININLAMNDGRTPLFIAATKGHIKVVDMLLKVDVIEVNEPTKRGSTPLLAAADKGHHKIVELMLRRQDILVNKAHRNGKTPLGAAHDKYHTKVEMLLMDKITTPNHENQTCLICLDRKPEVVLIPCGHQNLCGACAHQWIEEKKECPTERMPISRIVPLEEGEGPARKKMKI